VLPVKLDLSVAPEIARLADWPDTGPAAGQADLPGSGGWPGGPGRACGTRTTTGYLAGCLELLVAEPQRWRELVRFDPREAIHVAVTTPRPGCEVWLLVAPHGYRGGRWAPRWEVACLIAGEMAELASTQAGPVTRPLRPGRIRVRGEHSRGEMINAGHGYAITLHARSQPVPPPGMSLVPAQRVLAQEVLAQEVLAQEVLAQGVPAQGTEVYRLRSRR
jgi:hypothetical protein